MQKILTILSVLLLFSFLPSLAAMGQESAIPQWGKPLQAADTPSSDPYDVVRNIRELMEAVRILQQVVQRPNTEDTPYARALDNVVQTIRQVLETQAVRPATTSLDPVHNTAKVSLNTEKEKAYTELARQYFYVFATAPVEVSPKKEGEEAVPTKSKREETLDNFTACIKKIPPAAQINLIQELIRSSRTNDELKLLEGLLDEVCVQSAGDKP